MDFKSILEYVFSLAKLFLFWVIVFVFWRILFIVINYELLADSGAGFIDTIPILWHSLELDISTASYFIVIVFILQSISFLTGLNLLSKISNFINYIFILAYSFLGIGEIALYPEWKMKVNAKALEYLSRPAEVIGSNKTGDTIWQFAMWVLASFVLIVVYHKFFSVKSFRHKKPYWLFSSVLVVLSAIVIFIAMRGGIQQIPISQSQSYFSENEMINDISVNSAWNLAFNIINTRKVNDVNIFQTFPGDDAKQIVDSLNYCNIDTTSIIVSKAKPNVLFIILESWSADLVGALGAKKGITNHFDTLCKEGLLFTDFYANGNRSQQGLAAILGAFPALPITTLTTVPEKMRHTATITRVFNANNYNSAFYYGGELRYGNIKAYLIHNHFNEIEEDKDWNSDIPRGKLGIADEYMFDLLESKLESKKEPFFVSYFTLSSHSPYDQPMKPHIDMGDTEDDFHNSAYYTDSCIGDFMIKARLSSWYKNTLIVFVADHSHQTYTHRSIATAKYRHIPMLITGGALKKEYRGKTYTNIGSQVDIAATILHQLGLNADTFYWSKDLFNPYEKHFAYFELNQGFGWIRKDGYLSYDHFNNSFIFNTIKGDKAKEQAYREGAAYLQTVFQEFIDL